MVKNELKLYLNDSLLGTLTKHENSGLSFKYNDAWLTSPETRPLSMSLPLSSQTYTGNLVYNFFDNLLPDNPAIRSRIQANFQIETSQPFDLLSVIGKDCVGAIQFRHHNLDFQKKILGTPLTKKEIAYILKNTQSNPLGMKQGEFRISIAGVQEKTAFLWHKENWHLPLDTTPTTHIFKLPIGHIEHQNLDLTDSCENEWLCAEIAKQLGFSTAATNIKTFQGAKALCVERFDRRYSSDRNWILRLPQEDLCQALGYSPNLKYESDGGPGIMEVMHFLKKSSNSQQDRKTFFQSQVLFYLLGAIDGHAKNFSIFLKKNNQFSLTPLYDIMSAYPLIAKKQLEKQKIKMAMGLHGKNKHYHWNEIQKRHFLLTAKQCQLSEPTASGYINEILEKVDDAINRIKLPKNFPDHISNPIFKGIKEAKKRLLS